MPNLDNKDLVVVDVETSGVNPFRHDVLAVGLVPMDSHLRPLVVYVRPSAIEWSDYARRNFQKYSSDWERAALAPSAACEVIEGYLADTFGGRRATAIGHNVGFDVAFLRRLASLGGREQLAGLSHRAVDTHTLLYLLALEGKIPNDAVTSDGALKHFEIFVEDHLRHTALGDALATRDLTTRIFTMLVEEAGQQAVAGEPKANVGVV